MGSRVFRYGSFVMWLGATAAIASCGGRFGAAADPTPDAGPADADKADVATSDDGAIPYSAIANSYPARPTVNGTHLYFENESGSTRRILTCPLTGCSVGYPKILYASTAGDGLLDGQGIIGIAVGNAFLYVARFQGGIVRFDLAAPESIKAGSGVVIASTSFGSNDLDLDGTTLHWAETNSDLVNMCTAPACAPVTTFLTGRTQPAALAHDANYVYGLDLGIRRDGGGTAPATGTLWRALK